jgi:hypothetical protein
VRRAEPPFSVEYDPKNKFHFRQDTPDDEWLSKVGAEGWIVFSHDQKWHDEQPAIAAIKQHKIGCFYLWGANDPTWAKMSYFIRSVGKITNAALHAPKPFIFHVRANLALERISIPADLPQPGSSKGKPLGPGSAISWLFVFTSYGSIDAK